jgi:P27 family predicted phage terminase small subunit
MQPAAKAFWDETVPALIAAGVVGEADTPALQACCEVWALYRLALEAAAKGPVNPSATASVKGYFALWTTLASKLGLTPAGRQRLVATAAPAAEPGSLAEFNRCRVEALKRE